MYSFEGHATHSDSTCSVLQNELKPLKILLQLIQLLIS